MDSEYDRKFEELKTYIPFLEGMIQLLESSRSKSNPRQAQLDKIRSLRDLLLNKKKRMQMENLLKCEQVLINLRAKVNQGDKLSVFMKNEMSKTEQSELSVVRNKLKSVVSKYKPDNVETLPEIARASDIEEVCLPGSKEPALFQRRPNLPSSTSSQHSSSTNQEPTKPKNSYTRVLVSPPPSETYWSNETSSEKQLYSRRSPKKSPRKRSPHKKERKKSTKNKFKHNRSRDLNITLNVPEDKIDSLNTKDILSRIINCSDNDVDIASLRELRTQILGELKETGTSDDISDIILKSYKTKIKQSTASNKTEIEEGELSDSESEAIESIYGSLVVLDKNKDACTGSNSSDKEKQRKIQLRLVYSDKTKPIAHEDKVVCVDTSDFETFNKHIDQKNNEVSVLEKITQTREDSKDNIDDLLYNELILDKSDKGLINETPYPEKREVRKEEQKIDPKSSNTKSISIKSDSENKSSKNNEVKSDMYKPLVDEEKKTEYINESKEFEQLKEVSQSNNTGNKILVGNETNVNLEVSIPLLEPTQPILVPSKEVSEIDILQALKKEILCETTNVLNTDATSAVRTPVLHQPKITKVTNAKEIGPKKRISIENYKAKTCTSSKLSDDFVRSNKEDTSRKQSLKLTEKECERFNFLSKLTLTESSDDEDKSSLSLDDLYTDLAPKSPDHDDFADTGIKPPVIIPVDPVQKLAVGSELDVDMRKSLPIVKPTPLLSPVAVEIMKPNNVEKDITKSDERVTPLLADPRIRKDIPSVLNQDTVNLQTLNVEKMQSPLSSINVDQTETLNVNSKIKSTELNMTSNIPPLLPNMTQNGLLNSAPVITPMIPLLMTPKRTPNVANMTPNRTSNIVNMTPNRTQNIVSMTPKMTPSHHTYETEDYSNRKHVYAPMFSAAESRDTFDRSKEYNQWDTSDGRQLFWEEKNSRIWSVQKDIDLRENRNDVDYRRNQSVQRDVDYRDVRKNSVQSNHSFDQRDCDRMLYPPMGNPVFGKLDCPPTPNPSFGRLDCPPTPNPSFGRLDCPPTPNPSFGRLDCPPTPTPSFGRLDCPPTPTPSFGRLECPPTPVASFGRLDCPLTPVASFGRLDCPPTPTPSFGRGDKPMTPLHSLNVSECQLTPTHYFGRAETIPPVGPEYMGRSEYKSGHKASWSHDPRLNRSSDYEGNQSRDEDREHKYFEERKFYYNNDHQRDYKRYHQERSVERNDRNKSYERSHNYRDHLPRRETSVNRSFNREDREYSRSYNNEYENDRYSRNRGYRSRGYDYRQRNDYDENNRRGYHHDRSGGNTQEMKDRRENSKYSEQNKLRVNSHGGPSFTIDTSIRSSFQETDNRRKSSSDFDARRQRASSVGRTLSSNNKTSTHDINHGSRDIQKKNTNMNNFRRACSVGRDIESSKLDFKDVKADLKSFKLKSDFRFSKDNLTPGQVTESTKSGDPRNEHKLYSPRKNNRDPRMYREHKDSRDNKEYKSGIGDSNKYGIVYSNDNISKGTILGSGYGVKNYKIPKIRRQEVTEGNKTTNDLDEDKSSKNSEKNEIVKDDKNRTNQKQEEIEDLNKVENLANETCTIIKKDAKTKQITKNNITKAKMSNENCKEANEAIVDIINTSSDSIAKVEKRVTRSARKSLSEDSISLELSPIKRTRKSKKTLVVESDSDDNEIIKTDATDSKKKTLNTSTNNQKDGNSKLLLHTKSKVVLDIEDKKLSQNEQVSTVTEERKQESKIKSKVTSQENTTISEECKQELKSNTSLNLGANANTKKRDETNVNKQEEDKAKQIQDDLDSSFGLGNLEMFSDNVTSDPVIELNDLIADLDHDINSSKNTDANSHFTKELSLETMLENISNPNKTNDKSNVSFQEYNLNEIQKINEEPKIESGESLTCSDNKAESNDVDNIASVNSERSNKFEELIKNDSKETQFNGSEIQGSKINPETHVSENFNQTQCKQEKHSSVNPEEDACSNEAIVSTSEEDNNAIRDVKPLNILDNDTANAPDSTININVGDVEPNSISSTTNKLGCEMNYDISSTHSFTDVVSKDPLEEVSSDIERPTETQSISKFLSILQDKSKIKELLSLLGDQTSEKIKKKLEELSEIVSDDETKIESTHEEKLGDAINSNKIHDPLNINNDPPQKEVFETKVEDSTFKNLQKQNNTDSVQSNNETQQHIFKTNVESNCETSVQIENQENIAKTSIESNCETTRVQNENEKNTVTTKENVNITKMVIEENVKTSTINDDEIVTEEVDKTKESSNSENVENIQQTVTIESDKPTKKGRRRRRRGKKWYSKKKSTTVEDKQLNPADTVTLQSTVSNKPESKVRKKPSRELQKLHEDIREVYLKEDILSTTGIRMCRIAKLVEDKKSKEDDASTNESNNQEPLSAPNECSDSLEKLPDADKVPKKKVIKNKKGVDANISINTESNTGNTETDLEQQNETKSKEGKLVDLYDFESDSANEFNNASDTKNDSCSESESDSVDSIKSTESLEVSNMKKKVKRKRGRLWQTGVIKPKSRKKKCDLKTVTATSSNDSELQTCKLPDYNSFTDKNYCFRKQVVVYSCRLCIYSGTDIVHHYKNEHPHTSVPLSRLSPAVAKEAIKESEDANFQEISKLSSKKYVCRFCLQEFSRKKRLLEAFFWHVVSMHTGEYKHACSKCVDTKICPLDIDIPPPPKDANGQLLGYICEKCNYTQISLENLKIHVSMWHNDEQTAVYTINLANLSKNAIKYLSNHSETRADSEPPRVLRSSRSNQSMADGSDSESDSAEENYEKPEPVKKLHKKEEIAVVDTIPKKANIQSKITFESDITDEISNFDACDTTGAVKIETDLNEIQEDSQSETENTQDREVDATENTNMEKSEESVPPETVPRDIFDYPHFKVMYTESRSRVYVCCINGNDYHYKTALLISMKKHVQLNHTEKWDGYCCLCKVIVTPQGDHKFKDCFQHFLDKHIDSFPILEHIPAKQANLPESNNPINKEVPEKVVSSKSYINVRRLSELISTSSELQPTGDSAPALPVIESVVSLGAHVEQPRPSPSYPSLSTEPVKTLKQYKYEEFQADIMSRKHRVVLEAMMSPAKLVQVFKCAGRFCSFTTDSAEEALVHASAHLRVGGVDSLCCVYCNFDACGNAIDLITHVFKYHGCCPYTCSLCFYRAAANPLVNSHIKRVHSGGTNAEILKTSFQTPSLSEENILTREQVVPFYVCCDNSSSDGKCKYKTYVSGKFSEHLLTRHPSSSEFSCFVCTSFVNKPAELIRHFKTHGLNLYQCVWCGFGVEDEEELKDHTSVMHPMRQPKGYLRIITKKEGTSEVKVLPLAHSNKIEVPAIEVPRSDQKNYPVREAERSIELEKLIGHTNSMIDSMSADTEPQTSQGEDPFLLQSLLKNDNIAEKEDALVARTTTPPPVVSIDQSKCSTPILKAITLEETPEKIPPLPSEHEVVCLDSDDDSPPEGARPAEQGQSVQVQLPSNSSVGSEMKIVSPSELFACSKCSIILKCGAGFRKHINACFANTSDSIPCAHCQMAIPKKNIVAHYNINHCKRSKLCKLKHKCPICSLVLSSSNQAKIHMLVHSGTEGSLSNVVTKQTPGPRSRRKRCLETAGKSLEPPEKLTRYGPQDIDKLPINPILDDSVVCSLCEFNTKVRLNMVRHLLQHAQQQPVPQTAPVNPVPHLETNEKHFDKMLNLASSSFGLRAAERSGRPDKATTVLSVSPEAAARYPKYVCDKQRLTCGAKDCLYTSLDEAMLKCHWETLHYGTTEFHCVHCPPHQKRDNSKPVTASRIIAHLKMHDEKLYACSLCSYYHYCSQIVEIHLADVHKGGRVVVVREGKPAETSAPSAPAATTASPKPPPTPTMDLVPWQCGLCKFKSLLRPEVVDHCARVHNSKMQYKCAYCAFRTSNPENITKHQSKSHAGRPEEIFYYYYREGTVPDDGDGTARWQKQSRNTSTQPKVKSEGSSDVPPSSMNLTPPTAPINLNLVKKEVEPILETIDDLCKEFGQFCEPNGLKYKCPLCTNIIEDTLEAMQSHLYEELKYRKWSCSICSYKAFHKEGLGDHMQTEHRQNRDPIELPADTRVETWVTKLLEHQTSFIAKYKENLARQKAEILRTPGPSTSKVVTQATSQSPIQASTANKHDSAELEKLFGPFGAPKDSLFCCPICSSSFKEEDLMHNHMESELNKIRWYCSKCSVKFQTYHEAQFHSKSVHSGQGVRPAEVTRDATVRAAWVEAVIKSQKQNMDVVLVQKPTENNLNDMEEMSQSSDNSLLVVRYEKTIPTPEEEMARQTPVVSTADSDDEKLIIDEPLENRVTKPTEKCPHCNCATLSSRTMRGHILRHYNLKPYCCAYCDLNGARKTIEKHQKIYHATQPINLKPTAIPNVPPGEFIKTISNAPGEVVKVVCLVCRNYFTESDSLTHTHDKIHTTFGKKGDVVVKCNECFTFHKDVNAFLKHHKSVHSERVVNYVFSKLNTFDAESRESVYACDNCPQKFSHIRDMRIHADANHQSILKYSIVPKLQNSFANEIQDGAKRKCDDDSVLPPCKRTARKSTTKLPHSNFARKSTTKLPYNVTCETLERSSYGQKPSTEGLDGVVTMMSFCNKMVPFTLNKLKEIIDIDPVVAVEKFEVPECDRPVCVEQN